MNTDVLLVLGIIVVALSFTTWLSAYANLAWRWPPVVTSGIGLLIILLAWILHPGGYPPREVPGAFVRVLAMIFN